MPIVLAFCLSLLAAPQAAPAQGARVTEGPDDAPYYFLLGRYLEGEGKVDEAVEAIRKAIDLDPKSAEPRAELAALYARQDKAREAVEAAEQALKVDPRNREANRVLGSVLAALAEQRQPARPGDEVGAYPTRAITALEIARGDGTGDLSIDLTLARLYLDQDRPADAIPLLRRIVTEQPQYAEGSALLAEAQEAAGDPNAAVETLKALLEDEPQFFRGRVQLAELYERQHKWTEAADAWARVQALNSRNSEIASHR
jgi:tetratricopeptide (TPR) repeat protein